jgi:predicted SAM-dependent methyltransferase
MKNATAIETIPDGPKLNLGCGPVQPCGWDNIDGSNRAYLASHFSFLDNLLVRLRLIPKTEFSRSTKYHNLFKGLPYRSNSVGCIYAGELWEHFEYPDGQIMTKECFRVLKPGGVLRVCVPDGVAYFRNYLRMFEAEMAKPREDRVAKSLVRQTQMFFNEICTRKVYLGSMGHTHKWTFDEIQLIDMFETAGFSNVERMKYHESRIPDVCEVERSAFLIVEGVKAG